MRDRSPLPRRLGTALALVSALCIAAPARAQVGSDGKCPNGRSANAAMWLSIAHPGVGEWYLNEWGSFKENAPQRRFWLGLIPFYGWPGYLQVKSAIDTRQCVVRDTL